MFCPNTVSGYCRVGEKVRDWIRRICEWKRVEIIEGHVSTDHVHLVLSIPPKYAVSEVVGTIKGRVAKDYSKKCPRHVKSIGADSFGTVGIL